MGLHLQVTLPKEFEVVQERLAIQLACEAARKKHRNTQTKIQEILHAAAENGIAEQRRVVTNEAAKQECITIPSRQAASFTDQMGKSDALQVIATAGAEARTHIDKVVEVASGEVKRLVAALASTLS